MTMSANNNTTASKTAPEPEPKVESIKVSNPKKRVLVVTEANNTQRKYEYNLDDQNRVINRITYVRSDASYDWTPSSAYVAVYTNDESVLTYAEYNAANRTFTSSPKQQRFAKSDFPEVLRLPSACK